MSFHEGEVLGFPYIYRWGPRMGGRGANLCGAIDRKGQRCKVLARSPQNFNSALVEFEDGYLAVISRNALRKAKAAAMKSAVQTLDATLPTDIAEGQ